LETITHNLFAVIIQILCFKFVVFPLNIILTIVLAFLSHIFIDAIAIITYHTSDIQKDKFWLVWHVIIYILSILSIFIFMIPFWVVMIVANVMDLWDWLILRPIQNRKRKKVPETNWGEKYYFHRIVDATRNKLFYWLPKWNYKRAGTLIEILIVVVLVLLVIFFI